MSFRDLCWLPYQGNIENLFSEGTNFLEINFRRQVAKWFRGSVLLSLSLFVSIATSQNIGYRYYFLCWQSFASSFISASKAYPPFMFFEEICEMRRCSNSGFICAGGMIIAQGVRGHASRKLFEKF